MDYPVAAYATVYASEWVVPANAMEWLRQQSSPISYRSVIERFAQMTKGPTNIFHVEFRCMVQIVATIGNPISADILKSLLPAALEIRDSVYGASVRVSAAERLSTLNLLKEKGYIVSVEQNRLSDDDFIIWLVGSSTFYPVLEAHRANRDAMQAYWKARNQTAIQRPAQIGDATLLRQRQQQEQLANLLSVPASAFLTQPRLFSKDKWVADYTKVEHTGITREEMHEAIKQIKDEDGLSFDASISLSVKLEMGNNVTRSMFYTYIALGANPNRQDYFKETNLHRVLKRLSRASASAKETYLNYITWLMDVGADPDLQDEKGVSSRDLAKRCGLEDLNAFFDLQPTATKQSSC